MSILRTSYLISLLVLIGLALFRFGWESGVNSVSGSGRIVAGCITDSECEGIDSY